MYPKVKMPQNELVFFSRDHSSPHKPSSLSRVPISAPASMKGQSQRLGLPFYFSPFLKLHIHSIKTSNQFFDQILYYYVFIIWEATWGDHKFISWFPLLGEECSHRSKHHSGGGHLWAMTLLVQTSGLIFTKDMLIRKWYTQILAYLLRFIFLKKNTDNHLVGYILSSSF